MVFGDTQSYGGIQPPPFLNQAAAQQQMAIAQQQMDMAAIQQQIMYQSQTTCTPSSTSYTYISGSNGSLISILGGGGSSNIIGLGGGGSSNTIMGTSSFNTPSVFVVDEDEYMNHAEYYELARQRGVMFRIRTAEEKRLAEEAAERQRIEIERVEREREEAKNRSLELLLSNLTDEQRKTFNEKKWFIVEGGKSKTKYRIRADYGIAGNIEVLTLNRKVATLCCHCSHDIPYYDQFLAQKLSLMFDEENFLRIANRRAA